MAVGICFVMACEGGFAFQLSRVTISGVSEASAAVASSKSPATDLLKLLGIGIAELRLHLERQIDRGVAGIGGNYNGEEAW